MDLRLVGDGGGAKLLAASPEGEASAGFTPPSGVAGLAADGRMAARLRAFRGALGDRLRDMETLAPPVRAGGFRELGGSLFDALFPPPILGLFDGSLGGRTEGGAQRRLRIRLRFDLDDPISAGFARLPWELAFDRRRGSFLCLDAQTPIVRAVDARRPIRPPRFVPPLRVLAAGASPSGVPALRLGEEVGQLESSWRRPAVEVTPLEKVTRDSLRSELAERPVHLLHFMGHGHFDRSADRGSLLFDNGRGGIDEIYGEELTRLVRNAPDLRLVVLNACDSARASARQSDAFASVAMAMGFAGVPAVIAMQQPIADSAAVVFGAELHERLAAGAALEEAVTWARLAVQEGRDWMAPILFLRSPDGELFADREATRSQAGESVDENMGSVEAEDTIDADRIDVAGERGRAAGGPRGARNVARAKAGKIRAGCLVVTGGDHRESG